MYNNGNMISLCIWLIVIVALLAYHYLKQSHRYWEKRNVQCSKPNLLLGHNAYMFNDNRQFESTAVFIDKLYQLSKGEKYFGFYSFHKPYLIIKDLDVIKCILTRDCSYFRDRGLHFYQEWDGYSHNLFFNCYSQWKPLRKLLGPLFTARNVKLAFEFVKICGDRLTEYLADKQHTAVEMKDLMERYTIDVISSYFFGIETNSLKNPEVEFKKMGDLIFGSRYIRQMVFDVTPFLLNILRLPLFKKEVTDFFHQLIFKTIVEKESKQSIRGDFLDLLIELKNDSNSHTKLTNEIIVAECIGMFGAGYETSAITLAFCLMELARNQHIQTKVQNEIDQVLCEHGQELTYQSLQHFIYLDSVIKETQRLYPALFLITRKCNRNYTIPGTNSTIDENTEIIIPTFSIQRDPKYYENPEVFNPENFLPENKSARHPFSFLTMGEGHRFCIGKLLSSVQVKVALISILGNYDIKLTEKMKFPLEFLAPSFSLQSKGGIWLTVSRRISYHTTDDKKK